MNYLAWLQSWKGLGWGSSPMPFCTSSGPTSHRLTSAGAPSFAQGPSDPSLSLHGNINISVHKHWSDNPLLSRALSSPAGVFIDPAQNTSWHSVQDSQKGLLQFRPHHSSLRTPCQGCHCPPINQRLGLTFRPHCHPPSPNPLCNIGLIVAGLGGQSGCIWLPHLVRKLPLCPSPQSENPSFFLSYLF